MILTCPSCSTRYLTDAAKFQPRGRTVRCGTCGYSWFQSPPREGTRDVVYAQAQATAAQPMKLMTKAQTGPTSNATVITAWAALALVVAAIIGGVFMFKDTILAVWPKSATAYQSLDLPANRLGLDIRNVETAKMLQNGTPVLRVRGEVVNISDRVRPVPPLRVSLQDGLGNEIYHVEVTPNVPDLSPNASSRFEAIIPRATSDVAESKVAVTFSGDSDAMPELEPVVPENS